MFSENVSDDLFFIRKNNIYLLPVLHYNMETAALARKAFIKLSPKCVAVELAETMQLQLQHATSRLPDVSVVITDTPEGPSLYYVCEPCDAAFEGIRSALEAGIPSFCIDLDVNNDSDINEPMPDPYAIHKIGLKKFYEIYRQSTSHIQPVENDRSRGLYMAKRLKELSLLYDTVLFIGGMAHIQNIYDFLDSPTYPSFFPVKRNQIQVCTLTEPSCRDVMAEYGWISSIYEQKRADSQTLDLDRQKILYQLYKSAALQYSKETGNSFPGYHMRNIMKFARNYSLITGHLLPNLYQILSVAKGCVDHNYAYEVWLLATTYVFLKNVDNLPELNLSAQEVWGHSKTIKFHLKQPGRKPSFSDRKRREKAGFRFKPPGMFTICSYPPEDLVIERFGNFLKKKGTQLLTEESARVIPFSTSLEEGVDTRETIRHWHLKKLYVKAKGKPPGGVGSVVMIFDEDQTSEPNKHTEKYPWKTTWTGEHNQESDMAFYATRMGENIVGPGICRCEYGGFMMTYPPRRVYDVWSDPDYELCRTKAELLITAAIDYALQPLVVYVAANPPRTWIKSFARRYGKKIVYIPIGQLSPLTLNKLRAFHVLDGRDKRECAEEYIY